MWWSIEPNTYLNRVMILYRSSNNRIVSLQPCVIVDESRSVCKNRVMEFHPLRLPLRGNSIDGDIISYYAKILASRYSLLFNVWHLLTVNIVYPDSMELFTAHKDIWGYFQNVFIWKTKISEKILNAKCPRKALLFIMYYHSIRPHINTHCKINPYNFAFHFIWGVNLSHLTGLNLFLSKRRGAV